MCAPYLNFKNVIYEDRLITYETTLLTEEVIGLIRLNSGKIDHTAMGGSINSKDISDAVCGAIYNASQHAEEFAYDLGEDLTTISQVSMAQTQNEEAVRRQISVDFENELNNIF